MGLTFHVEFVSLVLNAMKWQVRINWFWTLWHGNPRCPTFPCPVQQLQF